MPASRSRRKVPTRTAKGKRRVPQPRTNEARRPTRRTSPRLPEAIAASVEDRARRFRRRVRRGIPIGNRKRIDTAVHDLRTSARRLLAALEALSPFVAAKRQRRLSRRIEGLLNRSGDIRDVGVELEMLPTVETAEAGPALGELRERLRDKHEQGARKLHRRLRTVRGLRADVRRVLKRAFRRARTSSAIQRAALEAVRDRFSRLRKTRLAVDPSELQTIHRMRIELKKFRYLMEALRPVARGVSPKELESLHRLQTTMGDLHDLEVLSSTIARHVAKAEPDAAAPAAAALKALEERHSTMLRSFLEAVDPTIDSWERILSSGRRWAGSAN